MARPVRLFISYAREDEAFLKELDKTLTPLKRDGLVQPWHDRCLIAGEEWKEKIISELQQADIILLLVSRDFIHSSYCFEVEMRHAIERHEQGTAKVIPIIVRPSDWKSSPLSSIQALPMDAKPVTTWSNQDEAWLHVSHGIRQLFSEPPKNDKDLPQKELLAAAKIPAKKRALVPLRLSDNQPQQGVLFARLKGKTINSYQIEKGNEDNGYHHSETLSLIFSDNTMARFRILLKEIDTPNSTRKKGAGTHKEFHTTFDLSVDEQNQITAQQPSEMTFAGHKFDDIVQGLGAQIKVPSELAPGNLVYLRSVGSVVISRLDFLIHHAGALSVGHAFNDLGVRTSEKIIYTEAMSLAAYDLVDNRSTRDAIDNHMHFLKLNEEGKRFLRTAALHRKKP